MILKISMKRGEIWLINLDPTVGAEIRKSRPAVIVNDDALGKLPLKIIVPLTDWKDHYSIAPWMIKIEPDSINNLSKTSADDCFQVRSVSVERITKMIGNISEIQMKKINSGLASVLKIT
mgnify:FL=1